MHFHILVDVFFFDNMNYVAELFIPQVLWLSYIIHTLPPEIQLETCFLLKNRQENFPAYFLKENMFPVEFQEEVCV